MQATSKDRLNVGRGVLPMNLRAILATQHVVLPRFPGLEWQDDLAAKIQAAAATLPRGDDGLPAWGARADLWEATLAAETARGRLEQHVAWAMRDGFDTHELSVIHKQLWRSAVRRSPPTKRDEAV